MKPILPADVRSTRSRLEEFEGNTMTGRIEITVAVYVDGNLDQFDSRSRRLIETGE